MDKIFEDKELAEIEKEKAKEELKSLKLDNIKKQQEIESNAQLRISRSNFYEILNEYDRLDSVEFLEEDEQKNKVIVYQRIPQIDFEKYIIQQDTLEDEVVENAMIAIVSPVLSKNTKNIKWRGYYNGELVPLIMKSEEFVTSVDEGLIEFKNGFIINCNMRIEREKKKDRGIGAKFDRDKRFYGVRAFDERRRTAVLFGNADQHFRAVGRKYAAARRKTYRRALRNPVYGNRVYGFRGKLRR